MHPLSNISLITPYKPNFNHSFHLPSFLNIHSAGGPLIKEHPDDPKQDIALGVVSWGEQCGSKDFPGVYARISESRRWITDTVCNVLSPQSCLRGRIVNPTQQQDEQACKDHIGILPQSRYRSCAWVKRYSWLGCLLYKDDCPETCGLCKVIK